MAKKGVRGFFMHSRSGLLTPYMSKRWLDMIELMVKEAERYSIEAWLYDEDPYPSGITGGRVIADHPEYKAKTLGFENKTAVGPCVISMDIPMSRIIRAMAVKKDKDELSMLIDVSEHIGSCVQIGAKIDPRTHIILLLRMMPDLTTGQIRQSVLSA